MYSSLGILLLLDVLQVGHVKAFELKEDDSLITEIKQLDTQIANLKGKQEEYTI